MKVLNFGFGEVGFRVTGKPVNRCSCICPILERSLLSAEGDIRHCDLLDFRFGDDVLKVSRPAFLLRLRISWIGHWTLLAASVGDV